jgi:DegV family protein with EDD domain
MARGKNAVSSPPDVKTYTEFFANALKKAHNLIHITITSSMSDDYAIACEAARSFDNVTVINSECLSSATGILVLIAYKLSQQNNSSDEIEFELEEIKKRLHCSFVIDTTEYMAKKGLINKRLDGISRALSLHPSLKFKEDKSGIESVWAGSTRRAYRKYIRRAFPVDIIPDSDVVIITYADVPIDTLQWIKDEISKIAYFEHVVFKQASAAISSNCGPGSFGIMYFVKSNKNYNIGSFIDDLEDTEDEEDISKDEYREVKKSAPQPEDAPKPAEVTLTESTVDRVALKWYQEIPGIDGDAAISNSGSEDAFRAVLKIFYDSIEQKASELNGFFSEGDWQNYIIKIHALKSSAKLIGAMDLSEKALKLEMAGKEGNTGYIIDNHLQCMEEFTGFKDLLSESLNDIAGDEAKDASHKPVADDFLMKSVYDELRSGADAMDCERISEVLKELDDYAIPDSDKEKFNAICLKAQEYDYDAILEILDKQ